MTDSEQQQVSLRHSGYFNIVQCEFEFCRIEQTVV